MNTIEGRAETSRFAQIEKIFNSNPELLKQAITRSGENNNRKLAFFGDSVLGIIISQELFKRFPALGENYLTHMRAALVNSDTLAQVAREFGLVSRVQAQAEVSGRALSETVEALIGAANLAGGIKDSKKLVKLLMSDRIEKVKPELSQNPKSQLQIILQSHGYAYSYSVAAGRDGEQHFEVHCLVPELNIVAIGTGSSKQLAEKDAADNALSTLTAKGVTVKENAKKAKQIQNAPTKSHPQIQPSAFRRKKIPRQ